MAVAILAMVLPALLSFGSLLGRSDRIKAQFLAHELAISAMEEMWVTGTTNDTLQWGSARGWTVETTNQPTSSQTATELRVEVFDQNNQPLALVQRSRELPDE